METGLKASKWSALMFFALALTTVGIVWAQHAGESIVINQPLEEDLYAAGRHVEIRASIDGDAVVAGQWLTVVGDVSGDVLAAAEHVSLRGPITDDARVAGRVITFESEVGGHVAAAGHRITVAGSANITDHAWLAGSTVVVAGHVGRNLAVAGQSVEINGRIDGDVEVYAERVSVGPGASVAGDFTSHSETPPSISDEARIGGQIIHVPLEIDRPRSAAALVFSVASLAVATVILFLLFPGLAIGIVRRAQAAPLMHFAIGLAVFAAMPVTIAALFATAIGYVLALALMAAYAAVLLVGLMVGLFCIADSGLRLMHRGESASKWLRVVFVFIAAVLYAVVLLIPVIGWLIAFIVLLSGIGALHLHAYHAWRPGPT
jgi:cytoskeletal protein CcmA (bactofilin family)